MAKAKSLIIFAYILTFLCFVGCATSFVMPCWTFSYHTRFHHGILTYSDINGDWRFIGIERQRRPDILAILLLYAIGLTLCLANVIAMSVHLCCIKTQRYKFCYTCGGIGLLSVVCLASSMTIITVVADIWKDVGFVMDWVFFLSIGCTSSLLLASIFYLAAGKK